MKELLSVIVPVYNLEGYIERTVRSIMQQSYRELEIILIDDGSTDGSYEICERLQKEDNRIVVYRKQNGGVTSARRMGLEKAHADYVSFIDGDDEILPQMYEAMMPHIKNHDMVSCGVLRSYSIDRVEKVKDNFKGSFQDSDKELVLKKMIYDMEEEQLQPLTPWLCNKLYHRERVLDIFYKMDDDITFAEDCTILYQYVLASNSYYFVEEFYYKYLFRDTSVCHTANEKMLLNITKVYEKLKEIFALYDKSRLLLPQLQKWLIHATMMTLNQFMGFPSEFRIAHFLIDSDEFIGKKVVLYGAGNMGKDVYVQLKKKKCDVVLWVDRDYKNVTTGYEVQIYKPEEILITEYDVVLICISRESVVYQIKKHLIELGVCESKISWKKPITIF